MTINGLKNSFICDVTLQFFINSFINPIQTINPNESTMGPYNDVLHEQSYGTGSNLQKGVDVIYIEGCSR